MKFLADENVPQQSVRLLRQSGFDVKSVGVEFSGVTDETVLNLAIREKRTILTFDRDYGELQLLRVKQFARESTEIAL